MNYFIHINADNTIVSINTYRKSGWIQYDVSEIFEPYDKIITIDECDTATEAAKRLLAGLEDGEFLGQCDPEPEPEQVEELYENLKKQVEELYENLNKQVEELFENLKKQVEEPYENLKIWLKENPENSEA